MSEIDFNEVADALDRASATTNAAESHGTLCGMYCVSKVDCAQIWVDQALSDTEPNNAFVGECRDVLMKLYNRTRDSLEGPDMSFELLLPDDEMTLATRAEGLADWCQGFLYGLSLQGISDTQSLPGEVSEIMVDFSEITKASFDAQDDLEESEQAYADVIEFVRVGVQLVLETLNPKPSADAKLH